MSHWNPNRDDDNWGKDGAQRNRIRELEASLESSDVALSIVTADMERARAERDEAVDLMVRFCRVDASTSELYAFIARTEGGAK